jgi:hypothetical protein
VTGPATSGSPDVFIDGTPPCVSATPAYTATVAVLNWKLSNFLCKAHRKYPVQICSTPEET